jgi:hypothetical protein
LVKVVQRGPSHSPAATLVHSDIATRFELLVFVQRPIAPHLSGPPHDRLQFGDNL